MMTSTPVGLRLAASALTCALLGAALTHPGLLPRPAQRGLASAVNGAARFWLWVWNEPADALDNPNADWSAVPTGWQQTAAPAPAQDGVADAGHEPLA